MGEIIYTANPLQVFGVQLAISAFIFGLGIIGIVRAFRQMHSLFARGVMIGFSLLVIVAGLLLFAATWYALTGATKTMTARLTGKNIVSSNSSDSAPTPIYRLNVGLTTAFDVSEEAYKKMNIGECYQVTYYPNLSLGLFANPGPVGEQYPGSVGEVRLASGCK